MSTEWIPDLGDGGPAYLAIANAIEKAAQARDLCPGDRLPPQRDLAKRLGVDFTTVARGYVEARRRGLVDTQAGRGTFVLEQADRRVMAAESQTRSRRGAVIDLSMNMAPEPDDPVLTARMRSGIEIATRDPVALLRYQVFGGTPEDKEAGLSWMNRRGFAPSPERLFVTPGTHASLLAILRTLTAPGDTIASEAITYPGIRALAMQLGLRLLGLPMDQDGVDPDAFEQVCSKDPPKALYLNPTLHNPTTLTLPLERRQAICAVARRYGVPLLEDDAYGFVPEQGPPPLAALAPDITWHIAGLAKCLGAGLRIAYVVGPDSKSFWPFVSVMRTGNVMASPLTAAVATQWIEDGTADALLDFVRIEVSARQRMALKILQPGSGRSDPLAFNVWLFLNNGWTRSTFLSHLRTTGIGLVGSDAFTVEGEPAEAVRVCLGGPIDRVQLQSGLEFIAHGLSGPPERATGFF